MYLCFALLHVWIVKVYQPGDERRHAKYAVVLEAENRLPTAKETRAATHPPLYYALVAKTVMRGVESTQGIDGAVRAARCVSVFFGAVALIFAFLIVRLLLPNHPALAVHATAIMAVIPSYSNNCAVLGNDSLALASQFAMIYFALLILLRGPSWRRCLVLALILSIVALTRVSGLLVMPIALFAVGAGTWWHAEGSPGRRAVLTAVIPVALIAWVTATSGWFYLGNIAASGDPTGQAELLAQVRNHPVRSPFAVLFDPRKWLEIHDETWGRLAGSIFVRGSLEALARILTLVSLAGAAVALWQVRFWERLTDWRSPRFFAWLVVAGVFASVFLPTLVYHARGGGLHQRYTFGALYVTTLVLAMGFTWTGRRIAPVIGYVAAFLIAYSVNVSYAGILVRRVRTFPIEQALAAAIKYPTPTTTILMVGLFVGLLAIVYALAVLHRPLRSADAADEQG